MIAQDDDGYLQQRQSNVRRDALHEVTPALNGPVFRTTHIVTEGRRKYGLHLVCVHALVNGIRNMAPAKLPVPRIAFAFPMSSGAERGGVLGA